MIKEGKDEGNMWVEKLGKICNMGSFKMNMALEKLMM